MEAEKSQPVSWVGEQHLGYVINTGFSEENTNKIASWLEGLQQAIPEGIYAMGRAGLHITVLDWVAPLEEYDVKNEAGEMLSKEKLYGKLYESYDQAFTKAISDTQPFTVHFNEVRVTPGTIILVGHDDGQFQAVRDTFKSNVALPNEAKPFPKIVHSSLVRFVAPAIDLEPVKKYVNEHPLELTQRVEEFRLVKTAREPMQEFSIEKHYPLS